jgi:hypothetical protein
VLSSTLLGHYVLVTWLSFVLDYVLGFPPFGFHLTNIVLPAITASLVCILTTRLLARATAWPSATCAFGGVAAARLIAIDREAPSRRRWLSAAVAAYALAQGAKSVVMMAPLDVRRWHAPTSRAVVVPPAPRPVVTRLRLVLAVLCVVPALLAGAAEADRPEILNVAIRGRLVVGQPGEARVTYRAPRANVVAVIRAVEDLDGGRWATRQQELSVVAAAFGYEAGELAVPLVFTTPGRKRAVFVLVTDAREESEPANVEIEVAP